MNWLNKLLEYLHLKKKQQEIVFTNGNKLVLVPATTVHAVWKAKPALCRYGNRACEVGKKSRPNFLCIEHTRRRLFRKNKRKTT